MRPLNPEAPIYKSVDNQHWERLNNLEAPKDVAWVLNNKKQILELHSSKYYCRDLDTKCTYCQRFFKPCMIWNIGCQDWLGEPKCRWCHADLDSFDDDHKFEIGGHIHCNKRRHITCGRGYLTFDPPTLPSRPARRRFRPSKHERVSKLDDLKPPKVVFTTINLRMSQRERKKLIAEQNAKEKAGLESKPDKKAFKKKKHVAAKMMKKIAAEKETATEMKAATGNNTAAEEKKVRQKAYTI